MFPRGTSEVVWIEEVKDPAVDEEALPRGARRGKVESFLADWED